MDSQTDSGDDSDPKSHTEDNDKKAIGKHLENGNRPDDQIAQDWSAKIARLEQGVFMKDAFAKRRKRVV